MQIERPVPKLSPRESQLVKLAAEGLTDLAIAQRLEISEATVGTYWGRVRVKFGPFSRTELVAIMMRAEREKAVEDLRRENEELLHELQLQGSSGSVFSYRDMLENAPDAMILVDEKGIIEFANIAAQELFGFNPDEMQGLDHTCTVPERFHEIHNKLVDDYFHNPVRHPMGVHMKTPAKRKDGSEFLMRASLSVVQSSGGLLTFCIVRPISD